MNVANSNEDSAIWFGSLMAPTIESVDRVSLFFHLDDVSVFEVFQDAWSIFDTLIIEDAPASPRSHRI